MTMVNVLIMVSMAAYREQIERYHNYKVDAILNITNVILMVTIFMENHHSLL